VHCTVQCRWDSWLVAGKQSVPCAADQFRCSDGDCISRSFRCDGRSNCRDGSDERGCPVLAPVCSALSLLCHNIRI
jgi:hypothetical protein